MEISSNLRRKRVRRRIVRRLSIALGFLVALCPSSAGARERSASSPRRVSTEAPPWSGPGGYSPPRPLGSTGGPGVGRVHPAIHHPKGRPNGPLFPRASKPSKSASYDRDRAHAMARHPAGKAIPRNDEGHELTDQIVVERGDSLWSLAETRVGSARAPECWPSVYRLNRRTIGNDPSHIEPGQRLSVPRKECG